jgi:hypothetical protein
MYKTEYINEKEYTSIYKNIDEIISILTAICRKTNIK